MNSQAVETVKGFVAALEARDWHRVARHVTGDFVFSGPPQPLRNDGFLALMRALGTALPDWSFNLHDVQHDPGGTVSAKMQITGTHTGPLALPMFGLPEIPASGKRVSLPEDRVEFVPAADNIAAIAIIPAPGGGIAGLLEQLGARLPEQRA
jgi:predicted ester cyclase